MQWQSMGSRTVAPSCSVTAIVLCAVALCANDARAQVAIGPVRIDVSGDAAWILSAVRTTERAARERHGTTDGPREKTPTASPAASASATRLLATAERYLGVRYRWGGTSPRTGFDCSGFVQYVFAKHGMRLPRTSRQQASSGARLRPVWSTLQPGDLVMFAESGETISHVAIYVGRRRIIHASASGGKVRYDALDTKRGRWYARHLVAARRVSTSGASVVRDLLAQ